MEEGHERNVSRVVSLKFYIKKTCYINTNVWEVQYDYTGNGSEQTH